MEILVVDLWQSYQYNHGQCLKWLKKFKNKDQNHNVLLGRCFSGVSGVSVASDQ